MTFGAVEKRALRSVAIQFWVNGVVFASFIPRLPELRDQIGIGDNNGFLGLLLSGGTVAGFAASAVCGRLIARFGTKLVMIGGAVGLVAALPIIGLARGGLIFLIGIALMHTFDVLTDVAMNLQGSRLSAQRHAPVMNRLHGLWSLGTVVGGGASWAFAANGVGIRTHLFIVSGILLATVLYVGPGLLTTDETVEDAPGAAAKPARRQSTLVAMFIAVSIGAITVEIVPSDWAAIRLFDDLSLSASTSVVGFGAFTTGMVISRFSGDTLSTLISPSRFMQISVGFAVSGLLLATLTPSAVLSVIGFFIAGLGVAPIFPRLYDLAAQAPGRPGDALGATTAGVRAGALIVPVAVGALADSGSLNVGQAMAIVIIPAALGLLAMSRADFS